MVPRQLYAAHTEERRVGVEAGRAVIEGNLTVPHDARGVVLVVDCSGETLHRPSNIGIAEVLRRAGLATFVLGLLTAEEAQRIGAGGTARFNMQLLAERVRAATDWLTRFPSTGGLRIGCFGRDTAAAAVLVAAAEHPERVSAVVVLDGRPDLAREALACVRTPTLFMVAGDDALSIRLNEYALGALRCEKRLQVMPCPKCRFEHPAIVEWAGEIARDWLLRFLAQAPVLAWSASTSPHSEACS